MPILSINVSLLGSEIAVTPDSHCIVSKLQFFSPICVSVRPGALHTIFSAGFRVDKAGNNLSLGVGELAIAQGPKRPRILSQG